MGCAISAILFVAAFEVILIARQVVGGVLLPVGQRLPPLRTYMDSIVCLLQTAPCMSRLLKRLDELIQAEQVKESFFAKRGVEQEDHFYHWQRSHPPHCRPTHLNSNFK